MSDTLEKLYEEFRASMKWSDQSTEIERTLVYGNLNGFVSFLRSKGYAEIYEAATYAAWKYDSPSSLVEIVDKYKAKETP